MIIEVNEFGTIQTDRVMGKKFVEVEGYADNGNDRDNACRLAFRAVNKRVEKDYNELHHNTKVVQIDTTINGEFAKFLQAITR